jgi:phage tail sheath protein FI
MPATLTYPGVYIEEISSGVHTITGVATSITAFVGRTPRGPVNDPLAINSFADFERTFGGLAGDSPLSFAVHDFYQNGGSRALVVRLYHPLFATEADRAAAQAAATTKATVAADAVIAAADAKAAEPGADGNAVADAADAAVAALPAGTSAAGKAAAQAVAKAARDKATSGGNATATKAAAAAAKANAVANAAASAAPVSRASLTVGGNLNLEAANPGAWGNTLRARVDHGARPVEPGEMADSLFNLSIRDGSTGRVETMRNVSVQPGHARHVERVIKQESSLVRLKGAAPTTRPAANDPAATHGVVAPGTDAFTDALSTGVTTGLATDSQPLPGNGDAFIGSGTRDNKTGLYALEKADLFNLLCIPPDTRDGDTSPTVYQKALTYCVERRAMLIVDSPAAWSANPDTAAAQASAHLGDLGLTGVEARNGALYFPRVVETNPLADGASETFVPCGIVAGVMARTDSSRGVWKAPAGLDANLSGTQGLAATLSDLENGTLNPLGINCLRSFETAGRVVWGARTLRGADQSADEYKYVPVRRLALFIEESLFRGTKWVVFEPNDEPLWAQIRLNLGAFMHNLFTQGAFQGTTPREAYFVKCDKETTTQNDINLGVVNILVGFAPLKPAEFVVIKLQQMAGQIAT